jgi:glycerophosphoryl diester phosphodiesterase
MRFVPFVCLLFIFSCMSKKQANQLIDVQGHRGCRGLYPENTIPAFIHAVDLGVTTLEMDVVISKDSQVVVSHEPFMSAVICRYPKGGEISKRKEDSLNIYELTYSQIAAFDCGSKAHPQFPEQKNSELAKPLLADVIRAVEQHVKEKGLEPVNYNIETKCTPEGDQVYHPGPNVFTSLLMNEVKRQQLPFKRVIVQSFDPRTLRYMRQYYPEYAVALLIGNENSPESNINRLGFTPNIYSPYYQLVNKELMEFAKKEKMRVIPWTVNERSAINSMLEAGVHGIISDYPNRVLEAIRN